MKIKLLDGAIKPTRANDTDAGYDLYATEDVVVFSGETKVVDTGVCVEIPDGFFGGVYSRSGLSTKCGIAVINGVGVIDSSYRGSIKVPLHNHGRKPQVIKAGDRVAQLIIQPCSLLDLEVVDELTETKRGTGGFGSTGR